MSEQLPPQDFGSQHYERPNQKWICGHACEGQSCRLGPSHRGHCRATAECVPVLEKAEGEAKGRWRCTRAGGACENGPLPDGSCCRPVARCSPVPTLRTVRGRATWAVVAATAAVRFRRAANAAAREPANRGPMRRRRQSGRDDRRQDGQQHFRKRRANDERPGSHPIAVSRRLGGGKSLVALSPHGGT